ncbi:HAMP domain-containing sensor histidine kinase [Spartinivicinus poritis]|uniref:histidine kinase n=1 Tax=Spartinivicinus poritis TaxID=2994640 RepID=A0ABT5U8F7_9GAMM|nr:ATP-binding protein [Spartinivicinus sp. A2-2]MDE1462666.1 ATP-binding protein [Spartinivicinus sp. A2-2]
MSDREVPASETAALVGTRNSIATQLLKAVFSIYLLITIVLTLTHMVVDFTETKQSIYNELINISEAFAPVLRRSIWDLNPESTKSALEGMNKSSHVLGVLIRDNNNNIIGALGPIFDQTIEVSFSNKEKTIDIISEYEVFEHSTVITPIKLLNIYTKEKVKKYKIEQIGVLTLYSSHSVVFDSVKLGFALIIVNAVLKTAALWMLFLLFSRYMLAKPLAILSRAMEKVRSDNIDNVDVDLNVKKYNELTVLEAGFNQMISSLLETRRHLQNSHHRLTVLLSGIRGLSSASDRFSAMALATHNVIELIYHDIIQLIQFGHFEYNQKSKESFFTYQYKLTDKRVDSVSQQQLMSLNCYDVHEVLPEAIKDVENNGSLYSEHDDKLIFLVKRQNELLGFIEINGKLEQPLSLEDKNAISMLIESLSITLDNIYIRQGLEQQVKMRTKVLKDTLDQLQKEHVRLKETQSKLVHSEKMAGLGVLVAGVAHEINNPVNFVHVGGQNLEHELETFKSFIFELAGEEASQSIKDEFNTRFAKLFKHSNNILNGSTRIKNIVHELKSFSRFDEDSRSDVNIIAELRSTIKLVTTRFKRSVDFYCDFKSAPLITCWPAKLNQVFLNLLINACQAIQEKYHQLTESEVGHLFIRSFQTSKYVYISFEDDGIGMPKEVQQKIFDPFFTTKKVGEGTGLGLSLSHEIVERHDGCISVNTVDQIGTTITVSLPLHDHYED